MGTDIGGWIEITEYESWDGIVRIQSLINRHYDMFGCLFGVNNYAGFNPIVEERGMPIDSSFEVKHDWWQFMAHSHTWITWEEIKAIDWDEPAQTIDKRVHYYKQDENGKWQQYMKVAGGYPPQIKLDHEHEVQIGDTLYKVERMVRRDVFTRQWQFLFDMMKMLADRYGIDNVRLVVWFDS